jgi:hypothetical protein
MKYLPFKRPTFALVALILVLLAGCSRGAEPTPQVTQTPAPLPFEVTYCDINPAEMCLEGFGLEIDGGLLILFRAENPLYADIYIRAAGPEDEMLFKCQQAENFPENVYCLGEPFQEGELIKLNIYSKSSNKFIAIGVFNVQFSDLPESDIVFEETVAPTPSPEPTPTRTPIPSYPNPSYPNPTSTP